MKKGLISITSVFMIAIVAVSVYFGVFYQQEGASTEESTDVLTSSYTAENNIMDETLHGHGLSEPSPYYSYTKQKNGYESLEKPSMQRMYLEIDKNVDQISYNINENGNYQFPEIVINQEMTAGEIRKVLVAFQYDHPYVFWLANEYQYSVSGSQSKIQLYSYVSPDKCVEMQTELNEKLDQIVNYIPSGLTELKRELAVCKILESICVYDNAAAENTDMWQSYTVYGAFMNGKAVCEGYSKSAQLLLSYMGMECCLINGNADGSLHMWNLVKVDEKWYHLDVTWIDNESIPAYQYFNVTDKEITKDHTISPNYSSFKEQELSDGAVFNLRLPTCTSEDANYIKNVLIKINGIDSSYNKEIVDDIAKQIQSGENILYFAVDDSLDLDETVNQMFQKPPYKFLDYVKEANKQLNSDKCINYNNCKYTVDKLRGYMIVQVVSQQ